MIHALLLAERGKSIGTRIISFYATFALPFKCAQRLYAAVGADFCACTYFNASPYVPSVLHVQLAHLFQRSAKRPRVETSSGRCMGILLSAEVQLRRVAHRGNRRLNEREPLCLQDLPETQPFHSPSDFFRANKSIHLAGLNQWHTREARLHSNIIS